MSQRIHQNFKIGLIVITVSISNLISSANSQDNSADSESYQVQHGWPLLPEGFALGEAGVTGDSNGYFNLPTDIAVLDDGSFYVSDGYGNNRIVKYSVQGEFEFEWGKAGSGPSEFNLPHSVAVDGEGNVYVVDRSNFRIQVFTADGEYIREMKTVGWRPYALIVSQDNKLYVTDGGDKPAMYPYRSRVLVLDMQGNVLETFGRYDNYNGQFKLAHDIGMSPNGDVYVACGG